MEKLYGYYRRLLTNTSTSFVRYLHGKISWDARMIGLIGARGIGKTTLLLQHIKLNLDIERAIYIKADDITFSENTLFDFADNFYKNGGKHLFIDEIHKYKNWSKELKMMYDYFADLQVVFTGSSILDIHKGSDDLSRRALMYFMTGLSFREYLNMSQKLELQTYSFQEIISNKVPLPIEHPLPLFKEYLKNGYYPFFNEPDVDMRIHSIINQVLEVDIPIFSNMNIHTTTKLKHLMQIIAQSSPFKPNISKISEMLGSHRNQVTEYLYYMEKSGLISQLRNNTKGIRALGKTEKIYLNNTNLISALGNLNTINTGNIRETFFYNQMNLNNSLFSNDSADFNIDKYIFEIGGKNKGKKQIAGIDKAFIVKDDIEYGYKNTIPLWAFGFNY